jgi:hypothetical protein
LLNKKTKAGLKGWASPLADKIGFDLSLDVDKLALPILSPCAASLVGVDLQSGVLKAGVKAKAGALDGKIDLLINDLFVVPVSEKKAKESAASISMPAGFAVSVLKDGNGVITFGFPLSGTLDSPQVDYSEAINKVVGGAISSLLPTAWFAKDGNSVEMPPATFVAGTAERTKAGRDGADQMSKLFKEKLAISIRVCGRGARADLISMR